MRVPSTLIDRGQALARPAFAACISALGVLHVVVGEQIARLFQAWPASLPGRPYWAHVAGGLLVVLGIAALFPRIARAALALVGCVMLASVLALHLPRALPSGEFGDAWLNVLKWLAAGTGSFLMAATVSAASTALDRATILVSRFAGGALATFMMGAAILHVRFAAVIAQYYIPAYIPGRLFWTYFTAAALAAGGVGLLIPATARLAARLTSLMIFLWTLLLHIPRTVAAPRDPGEWCGIFESIAFAAVAWLLAEQARRRAAAASRDPVGAA